jgi:predicted nucleic acid-binding protein
LAAYYFDSSALTKCYIKEVGSAWVRGIAAPASGNDLHVLQIAEVEVTSAIVRSRKAGSLSPTAASAALTQLQHDLAKDYIVLDITDRLLVSAISLVQIHELRAYDAVQLAGVVELNGIRTLAGLAPATIVSADAELNAAARAEGVAVEGPNNHP